MKTYKGEKITKKEIQAVLRTLDVTAIYRLYYKIYGTACGCGLFNFVEQYAPSKRVRVQAFSAINGASNMFKRFLIDSEVERRNGIYHGNDLIELVNYVKRQCAKACDAYEYDYAKRPMLGKTHLYFCSPVYGHNDYNKVRSIPIAGNERFCELIVKYANKYFTPIYGK